MLQKDFFLIPITLKKSLVLLISLLENIISLPSQFIKL